MMPTVANFGAIICGRKEPAKRCELGITFIAAILFVPAVTFGLEQAIDPLQSLASDVWAQFELAYRSQPAEYERHRVQFNAVIEAWRAAPAAPETDERLANWMRAAIEASMPGSRTPLPPAPQFVPIAEQQKVPSPPPLAGIELIRTQYVQPTMMSRPIVRPVATAVADPFIEDPFFDDPVSR